jgi:hypothetical protein
MGHLISNVSCLVVPLPTLPPQAFQTPCDSGHLGGGGEDDQCHQSRSVLWRAHWILQVLGWTQSGG